MDRTAVFEVIKRNILEILDLPPEAVSQQKSLKDLGANSIDRMEIITMSLEDLRLNIPLVDLAEIKNIAGLVEFFYEMV